MDVTTRDHALSKSTHWRMVCLRLEGNPDRERERVINTNCHCSGISAILALIECQ